ncbi:MAG: OB-fold nucleic acid binding domain-containing protein [Phycisphaerae bacterium]|nr:OB-fold nucleic acid binding domain-containing protein [Saprospiraceae bacterium]
MFFQKNKNLAIGLVATLFLTVSFVACVKTDFDEPPVGGDGKDIPTNTTIQALKGFHITPKGFDRITEDLVISGTVIMDDRSGNYYKTIVIQDSTGGIEVKFSNGYLYNRYPVGRKIYIRCKGLMLTDYNDLIQLVGSFILENGQATDIGITENQERNQIVRGFLGAAPTPKVVSISQMNASLVSTLITLEGVQFAKLDTAQIWADAPAQFSVNRTIENCGGAQLLVRTSGFANFAVQKTPTGKGSITGVLGIYGNDYQLYIRDLNDVAMNGPRCGQGGGPETLVDLGTIRALFTGTTTFVPSGRKIKGLVISDRVGNNLNNRNLYLQDGTAGILVRFDAAHTFNLGDEVEISVSDVELSEYNKLLQLNNVPLTNASLKSSGNTITPRVATIAQINTNFNAWESTLVKISNVSITGGATLSGNRTLNDGSGTIAMFTSGSATFSSLATPATPVTLTAIVSDFNAKQVLMRNANDIQ